jgi:aldehyde:ferredoxin oxidoreductase
MNLLPWKRAAEVTEAVTGLHFTETQIRDIGERIVNLERLYLLREGVTGKDDQLPRRFLTEPIPDGDSRGALFEIKPMLKEYYEERGWTRNGVPQETTLRRLNLPQPNKGRTKTPLKQD